MSRHLFTSDLHLGGHEKVAELRGFSSAAMHDVAVVETLIDRVADADVLWIVGDLVGSAKGLGLALTMLAAVPGRKRLVYGNHDPAHPMNRRAWSAARDLDEVFEWHGMAATTRISGEDVLLSHFPYTRDRGEPRFLQWRLPNLGAWLLHGHTHGEEKVTLGARTEPTGFSPATYGATYRVTPEREIHVGWDAWKRPVADHEIADLMRAETYKETQ